MSTSIPTLDGSYPSADPAGCIHYPGDARWDELRTAWNLAVDQQPAAVAVPRSAEEVTSVVRVAARQGLRVTAQGTGHGAAAYASLHDTVLIKTHAMRGVQIDPARRVARVDAGALSLELAQAAGEHGLAALVGSSPDVGVVGYVLGGGVSWLSRRYGLAANSVTAVELVTAQGELLRADHAHHPDLFWALRGGGGSFGIVTAIELELFPVAHVHAGTLFFPLARAAEVLRVWRDWTRSVPDEVMSTGRMLQLPPIPDIPEPFRGRSFVAVEVIVQLPEHQAIEVIAPLRALGAAIDTVATIPAAGLSHIHMDPDHPVPGAGDGLLLSDLPDAAIDEMVMTAGEHSGSPLLLVDLRHVGGALARRPDRGGALGAIEASFALFAVGMAVNAEMAAAVDHHLALLTDALDPWAAPRSYMNFQDRPGSAESCFAPETYRRLRKIKAAYDPNDVCHGNHPITPYRSGDTPAGQAGPRGGLPAIDAAVGGR